MHISRDGCPLCVIIRFQTAHLSCLTSRRWLFLYLQMCNWHIYALVRALELIRYSKSK